METSPSITRKELDLAKQASIDLLIYAWSTLERARSMECAPPDKFNINLLDSWLLQTASEIKKWEVICSSRIIDFLADATSELFEPVSFRSKEFRTAHEVAHRAAEYALVLEQSAANVIRRQIQKHGSIRHPGGEFYGHILGEMDGADQFTALQDESSGLSIQDRISAENYIACSRLPEEEHLKGDRAIDAGVWSRLMTVKEIAGLLRLSVKNARRGRVVKTLKGIGSEIRSVAHKCYQVRLDTMDPSMRKRFEKE